MLLISHILVANLLSLLSAKQAISFIALVKGCCGFEGVSVSFCRVE